MSIDSPNPEIDLGQVFKKTKDTYNSFLDSFLDLILFLKRNIIILLIIVVIGGVIGYLIDKNSTTYNNKIIVTPNFGSGDYLYSKIDLLNSKITERDTVFLNSIGVKNIKNLGKIEIKPILDVYKFIENRPGNFELIRLMSENEDIEKIIKNDITSKNYPFHSINFNTSDTTSYKQTVQPILSFLNDSEYFEIIRKQSLQNINQKIIANDSIIAQINALVNEFTSTTTNQKSDKLVYYNENNQLNDLIKNKENLIVEQGNNKLSLINSDKIIKEISSVLNSRDYKGLNNKMKIIIPFIFLVLFFLWFNFRKFYKKQLMKRNL